MTATRLPLTKLLAFLYYPIESPGKLVIRHLANIQRPSHCELESKHKLPTHHHHNSIAYLHTNQVFNKEDYYLILGVPANADAKTIKRAYLEKAKQYHPDKNQNDPEAINKFHQIAKAYEVLGEKDKIQVHFIRGKYLLSLITNETEQEIEGNLDKLKLDDEFLIKIMNIRENIEESSSDNGHIVRELELELDGMAKKLIEHLESKNVDKIYEQLAKLKFIANCVEIGMAR